MDGVLLRLERGVWAGLAGIGLGLAVLLVTAWVQVVANGASLVDAYWLGLEPWTSAGIWLVLGGNVIGLLAATGLILLRGDWLRWLLAVVPLLAPSFWWLTALGVIPMPRYTAPDPVALAYSLPESAVLLLILPAVAAAALAFIAVPPDRRVRLRRVHTEPPEADIEH